MHSSTTTSVLYMLWKLLTVTKSQNKQYYENGAVEVLLRQQTLSLFQYLSSNGLHLLRSLSEKRSVYRLSRQNREEKTYNASKKLSRKQWDYIYRLGFPHQTECFIFLFFCAFPFTLFQRDEREREGKKLFVLSFSSYRLQNKRQWRCERIPDAKRFASIKMK